MLEEDHAMTNQTSLITRRTALQLAAGAAAVPAIGAGLARPAVAKAPMLGAQLPTHYRFKLGNFEITTLFDGGVKVPKVYPIFGQNKTAEEVAKLAAANFLPGNQMIIPFTPVVVNTGKEVVLFDAGNGARRRGKGAGLLAAALVAAGISPDQIDIVVVTHCHPDHIGGLMEGGKPLFKNARYVTAAVEYDFWAKPALAQSVNKTMAGRAKLVQSNVVPLAPKFSFLKPGGDVVTGIRAVDAAGHTPGHMAYHIESGKARLMLWADTTNHYVVSLQKPDWHVIFDMDKEKAVQARKTILDMVATDRLPAIGYHMPFPAVGYVEKRGSGYRWEPASYQLSL
jgi:glyoxylase-like metal-dependent hydrolase (beta-lactamase superfamily II)